MAGSSISTADGGQFVDLQAYGSGSWRPWRAPDKYQPIANLAISGTGVVAWMPSATGKKLVVLGGDISIDQMGTVLFFFGDSTTGFIHRTPFLQPNVPYHFDLGSFGRSGSAGVALSVSVFKQACNLTGTLYGCED